MWMSGHTDRAPKRPIVRFCAADGGSWGGVGAGRRQGPTMKPMRVHRPDFGVVSKLDEVALQVLPAALWPQPHPFWPI